MKELNTWLSKSGECGPSSQGNHKIPMNLETALFPSLFSAGSEPLFGECSLFEPYFIFTLRKSYLALSLVSDFKFSFFGTQDLRFGVSTPHSPATSNQVPWIRLTANYRKEFKLHLIPLPALVEIMSILASDILQFALVSLSTLSSAETSSICHTHALSNVIYVVTVHLFFPLYNSDIFFLLTYRCTLSLAFCGILLSKAIRESMRLHCYGCCFTVFPCLSSVMGITPPFL